MKIGFTGTREGMSQSQKEQFVLKLHELSPTEFHHGDCEGADAEAHDIVREFFPNVIIHVYPPKSAYRQAFKKGDVHYTPEEYLIRDRQIVDACDHLVGAPLHDSPTSKSGSWYTIRYAQRTGVDNTVLKTMTKKYYSELIHSNKVQCNTCNDIIESKNRHDFKWCSCGSVAVDGGKAYLKRAFKDGATYTELSITEQVEREPYDWEKE